MVVELDYDHTEARLRTARRWFLAACASVATSSFRDACTVAQAHVDTLASSHLGAIENANPFESPGLPRMSRRGSGKGC